MCLEFKFTCGMKISKQLVRLVRLNFQCVGETMRVREMSDIQLGA